MLTRLFVILLLAMPAMALPGAAFATGQDSASSHSTHDMESSGQDSGASSHSTHDMESSEQDSGASSHSTHDMESSEQGSDHGAASSGGHEAAASVSEGTRALVIGLFAGAMVTVLLVAADTRRRRGPGHAPRSRSTAGAATGGGRAGESVAQRTRLAGEPLNLLHVRGIGAIARSRWFPGVLQWMMAVVFAVVVYQLLLGPQVASENLGTALTWVLWWPVIPIVFVFFGRFWCAVCPFGTLNDLVQRYVGLQRRVPTFLKKYGIWIIDASFIAITWADHVWGIVESPWGSGVLFLLLTLAVVVTGALYQRRAFCRYLCFLGGLSGNYSRTGMVSLRANQSVCETCTSRAACFNGTERAPECPMFTFARTMDSNADCTLCLRCVKNCPNDALSLTVHPPTRDLWFLHKPRIEGAFLAMAIMGIVLIQNVTMLEVWTRMLDATEQLLGISSYTVVFTVAFLVAVSTPVALLALVSALTSRINGRSLVQNFTRLGYALIPLDIAGHIAHNLFHLLAEGKSVLTTAVVALGGTASGGSAALASTETIRVLQYSLVVLGVGLSLYTAWRLTRNPDRPPLGTLPGLVPLATLIVALGGLNLALFSVPMAHRM